MHFKKALLILAVVGLASVLLAPTYTTGKQKHYLGSKVKKPKKKVRVKKKFKPTGQPSISEVHEIISHENRRWGGPSISNRVRCESGYRYYANNGQYRGLLQFGPIWESTFVDSYPRKVTKKKTKTKWKPVYRVKFYSDGSRKKEQIAKGKQTRKVVKVGRIPKGASPYHGWAAVRAGQRAVSGHGPNTGWECSI